MQTKRKWLFWIFFGMTIVFIIGFGIGIFNVLKERVLSDYFLEDIKTGVEQGTEYIIVDNSDETVFKFSAAIKIAFYFIFGLFAMVFLYYFYFWLDSRIAKAEVKHIDATLERYEGVGTRNQSAIKDQQVVEYGLD
ncbi:MAG: hypothetical protein PF542_06980 [Nanoarchaeota archaeon]|jgi:ABC-type multidrug transport system fused ATPase/permease subunit|nr:hypothetical protein [Nanoarchaeota archaeon]